MKMTSEGIDQIVGHALSDTKAENRVRLQRIASLLCDALDAYEIGHPDVGHRRIEAALRLTR